jgi:hypothetical protein
MDGVLQYGPKVQKENVAFLLWIRRILSVTTGAVVDEVLMREDREEESLR